MSNNSMIDGSNSVLFGQIASGFQSFFRKLFDPDFYTIVRKPDDDFKQDKNREVVLQYIREEPSNSQYYNDRDVVLSKDKTALTAVVRNPPENYIVSIQLEFRSRSQSDLENMYVKWLSLFRNGTFYLPVNTRSGVDDVVMVRRAGSFESDEVSGNQRVFRKIYTLKIYTRVDELITHTVGIAGSIQISSTPKTVNDMIEVKG